MNNQTKKSIEAPTKLTKEIKENWLAALKSGKYTQGYGELEPKVLHDTHYCCIGVLGVITEGLDNSVAGQENLACPYKFLMNSIGEETTQDLYHINDLGDKTDDYEGGYKNVIPLIEQLETED